MGKCRARTRRWSEFFTPYTHMIEYRKKSTNANSSILSHIPQQVTDADRAGPFAFDDHEDLQECTICSITKPSSHLPPSPFLGGPAPSLIPSPLWVCFPYHHIILMTSAPGHLALNFRQLHRRYCSWSPTTLGPSRPHATLLQVHPPFHPLMRLRPHSQPIPLLTAHPGDLRESVLPPCHHPHDRAAPTYFSLSIVRLPRPAPSYQPLTPPPLRADPTRSPTIQPPDNLLADAPVHQPLQDYLVSHSNTG